MPTNVRGQVYTDPGTAFDRTGTDTIGQSDFVVGKLELRGGISSSSQAALVRSQAQHLDLG